MATTPAYCVSLRLFHCTLCKQLVFDHNLIRKRFSRPLICSCRAIGSKYLVVVWFARWFLAGYWGALFCRRGFGLVVSVVVPLMLAVLPYARGRGFDSRSRLTFNENMQYNLTSDKGYVIFKHNWLRPNPLTCDKRTDWRHQFIGTCVTLFLNCHVNTP
jgi:hypothetical protein